MLVTLPKLKDRGAIRTRITQVEAAVKEREELLQAAEALEVDLSGTIKNQERITTFLPSQKDTAGSLSMLSNIAAAHGVMLDEIRFLSEEKTGSVPSAAEPAAEAFRTFPLSIRVNGSYQALHSFLGALTESLRLTDVRSMTLAPQESGSDILTMEAELVTYYKTQ